MFSLRFALRAGAAFTLAALALTGCGHRAAFSAKPASVLRIGYQKGGSLNLLRIQGTLEKELAPRGITVEWISFPAGPQLLEGIGTRSIDLGSVGDTPPIFAQAAGVPQVYIANTPPSPTSLAGEAIIVPEGSPIHSVKELQGKRVAFQRGSGAHYFLLQALRESGLDYKDITPISMAPPDAQPAFTSGSIDAWVIWDPFLTIAKQQTHARVLRDARGLPTSGGFYMASRQFAIEHPDLVRAVLTDAKQAGDWAQGHPRQAAEILSPNLGLDVPTLQRIIENGFTTHYRNVDDSVIALQQKEANAFSEIGLIPKKIDIRADTLTPEQYARLNPVTQTAHQ